MIRLKILLSLLSIMVITPSTVKAEEIPSKPYFIGEKIEYSIKKMGIKVGEATLEFQGLTKFKDREAYLMIFTAQAFNFLDKEEIFIDPETFLPIVVRRNLNIFGKKETITEEYLEDQGMVKIKKLAGGKTSEQTIEKEGIIDNLYCFIYRYRLSGSFKVGHSLVMNLPTKDVKINLLSKTKIKTAGQTYDSFFMQSNSKDYRLWFADNPNKIPLRIDGALGFNSASLVMDRYQ